MPVALYIPRTITDQEDFNRSVLLEENSVPVWDGSLWTPTTISLSAVMTSMDFNDLLNVPTTLSGYGITDPIVLTSVSYSNPSWITALNYSKITSAPTLLSQFINDTNFVTSLIGDVTSTGNVTTLINTAVSPGSYTNTNLTVDSKGRITAASSGMAVGSQLQEDFAATTGQTVFTLTETPTGSVFVSINGLVQRKTEFTTGFNVLTFISGADIYAGDFVSIYYSY